MGLRIDLNADLGEGCPWDMELLKRVTSASVSCGAHAGVPEDIQATLFAAKAKGVVVGAHPGYPDRVHFGRLERAMTRDESCSMILEQVKRLASWAAPLGIEVCFLKPHGAFYNQAQVEPEIAAGVVQAAIKLGLPLLGLPGSFLEARAKELGVRFLAEGFADRRYTPEGRLVPRTQPDAVLEDPRDISAQAIQLLTRNVDTLCIHGDSPNAVRVADVVRAAIHKAAGRIVSFVEMTSTRPLVDLSRTNGS